MNTGLKEFPTCEEAVDWVKKILKPIKLDNKNPWNVLTLEIQEFEEYNKLEKQARENCILCTKISPNDYISEEKYSFVLDATGLIKGHKFHLKALLSREEDNGNEDLFSNIEVKASKEFIKKVKKDYELVVGNLENYTIIQFGP